MCIKVTKTVKDCPVFDAWKVVRLVPGSVYLLSIGAYCTGPFSATRIKRKTWMSRKWEPAGKTHSTHYGFCVYKNRDDAVAACTPALDESVERVQCRGTVHVGTEEQASATFDAAYVSEIRFMPRREAIKEG
jgi:hypothetical protein